MSEAPEEVNTGEAAPAPEQKKEPKAPKVELVKQNDVAQPKPGTKTRRVWDIADEISAEKARPAIRSEVMEQCKTEGLSLGTAATQFGRWCAFHGLTPEDMKAAREQAKAAEAPEPADEPAEA